MGSSMMCHTLDKYYADAAALSLGTSPLPSASLAKMEMAVMPSSLPWSVSSNGAAGWTVVKGCVCVKKAGLNCKSRMLC